MDFGPVAGDIIVLTDAAIAHSLSETPKELKVLAVFESLDVSWDPWGELAWAQRDIDDELGQKGSYYVIAYDPNVEGETFSFASYEVLAWTGG